MGDDDYSKPYSLFVYLPSLVDGEMVAMVEHRIIMYSLQTLLLFRDSYQMVLVLQKVNSIAYQMVFVLLVMTNFRR